MKVRVVKRTAEEIAAEARAERLGYIIPTIIIVIATIVLSIGVLYVRGLVTGAPILFWRGVDARRRRRRRGGGVDGDEEGEDGSGDGRVRERGGSRRRRISRKKEERRRVRAERREARERMIVEGREREELEREMFERRRERGEKREREVVEEERRRLEKEEGVYREWKGRIEVEDVGEVGGVVEGDGREGGVERFVEWIKERKVVVVEEVGVVFGLRSEEVVERLKDLEVMGRIEGVFDDRGRFVCVSRKEMEEIARFVMERGKVGIDELAVECSRIIRLDTVI